MKWVFTVEKHKVVSEEEKEHVLYANKYKTSDVDAAFLKRVSVLPFEIQIPIDRLSNIGFKDIICWAKTVSTFQSLEGVFYAPVRLVHGL